MVRHYILRSVAGLAGFLVLLYTADYIALRLRIHNGGGIGSVTVRRFYAVPQKSGKVEFLSIEPLQRTCTRSLFPQMGAAPCWYLARHNEERIDM